MTKTIFLDRVLSLSAADINALQEGRTIVCLPISQVMKGWNFVLYPHCEGASLVDLKIEIWATCESFRIIYEAEKLSTLSALTPWTQSELERLFEERGHLSLALLRVNRLPEPIVIPSETASSIKLGKFGGLSNFGNTFKKSLQVIEILPILSDMVFANRYQQITDFRLPEYPELESLQSSIALYTQVHPKAKFFNDDLRIFLGWADPQTITISTSDWIKEITTSGNSSDGNLFEKRVRQGFIHLGFTNTLNNIKASLDPEATGGAGGIDIYCEKPYPIVGECKASKHESVPNSVSAQLIHLGNTHLGREQFETSIKVIFAAGKLTDNAEKAAIENQINIMRPETLQRLVELKTAHPGSINLLELKPYLETKPFGTDADAKVNDFIDQVEQAIKLRSHIVKSVKALREHGDTFVSASNVRTHFNTAFAESLNVQLKTPEQAHGFLVELSSPLTGYLGRKQCDEDWKDDRFYYLRDLILPNSQI
jgi:hypothetical protein